MPRGTGWGCVTESIWLQNSENLVEDFLVLVSELNDRVLNSTPILDDWTELFFPVCAIAPTMHTP